jgi:secreted PhoX family phosphatase
VAYLDGVIYLTTKGDQRIWAYDVLSARMRVFYDAVAAVGSPLYGVDNIIASAAGDLLVAEDGGDLQVVAILPDGTQRVVVQIDGHDFSEVTGLAFSPDGSRLYFSSQRAGASTLTNGGATYELRGPFLVDG